MVLFANQIKTATEDYLPGAIGVPADGFGLQLDALRGRARSQKPCG
jgi:hypothetical protein